MIAVPWGSRQRLAGLGGAAWEQQSGTSMGYPSERSSQAKPRLAAPHSRRFDAGLRAPEGYSLLGFLSSAITSQPTNALPYQSNCLWVGRSQFPNGKFAEKSGPLRRRARTGGCLNATD